MRCRWMGEEIRGRTGFVCLKNLPPEYPYLVVETSDLKLSTTAILVDFSKAGKLSVSRCNMQFLEIPQYRKDTSIRRHSKSFPMIWGIKTPMTFNVSFVSKKRKGIQRQDARNLYCGKTR